MFELRREQCTVAGFLLSREGETPERYPSEIAHARRSCTCSHLEMGKRGVGGDQLVLFDQREGGTNGMYDLRQSLITGEEEQFSEQPWNLDGVKGGSIMRTKGMQ